MEDNKSKVGFPTQGVGNGFGRQGFSMNASVTGKKDWNGFTKSNGFAGFPMSTVSDMGTENKAKDSDNQNAKEADVPQEGVAPKKVKYYEGKTKLNKRELKETWEDFGGARLATYNQDGSAFIVRVINRQSKKTGVYFKLTERLIKDVDGYGSIEWRIDIGSIAKRKPAKQKFDESWKDVILEKVQEVVEGKVTVAGAAKGVADNLGVSYSTIRANLWVADKWSRGETTTFLPHRSMIRPIFDLMCSLGKQEETLQSMNAYVGVVKNPSEYVLDILKQHGVRQ